MNFLLPLRGKMLKYAWNEGVDTYVYTSKVPKYADFIFWDEASCEHISKVPKYAAAIFSEKRLLLCLKMLLDIRTLSKSRYRILSTTKTVLSVKNVHSRKPLDILTNISTSNVEEALNPSLTEACTIAMFIILDWI